jgi:hypothetical protein
MEFASKIALAVATVAVAGSGAALAIHFGNKSAAAKSLYVSCLVSAGGTYSRTISRNGGVLLILGPFGSNPPTVTLLAGVTTDVHKLVLAAATPAIYQAYPGPVTGLLSLGTTSLSVGWTDASGLFPQNATINVTVV